MVVIIKKGENVIDYIAGFNDAKRISMVAVKMAQTLKKNESKVHMVRFLGLRFFLLKVFFW